MRRLKETFRRRSPVPPVPAEGFRSSTSSDALASVIKGLDVTETAVGGLPILGLVKPAISTIRTVLQSVEKSYDNQEALEQLRKQVGILDSSVLKPLSECTEVPPALKSVMDNLGDKVKEAEKRWEKQRKRGRLRRSVLADRDGNDLQGFANDIKDALQTLKISADFQQIIQQFEEKMFEKLDKIPRVGAAGYDSGRPNGPERCLEDTRTAVLEKIWCWIDPPALDAAIEPTSDTIDKPTISDTARGPVSGTPVNPSSDAAIKPIYWVNGLAGIGKSTIARTVAEDAKHRKLLGASFFFSRQEKELSDPHLFIPTIAYQLARSYPEARSVVINVFQHDPDIVRRAFPIQFKELVIEPLRKITSKRVVIVVDALDECNNPEGAAESLFKALVARCTEAPSLRLLITSRPEPHIKGILTKIAGIVLHEDIEQSTVSDDIRKYLHIEMSQIPERLDVNVPSSWPSEQELNVLVRKAGKLFIWAAMAVRFVGDRRARRGPTARLQTLLDERFGSSLNSPNSYVDLDVLYSDILSQAVEGLANECIEDMVIIVGTVIQLRSEMPLKVIARILEQDDDSVQTALNRIQSIIPIPADPSRPIQIYHPSFPDFITNRKRCPDSRFYVDTSTHERRLALQCLDILNNRLSEGVETLLKPTERADAVSKDTVFHTIPQEVQYACRFWAVHVAFSSIDDSDEELMEKLDRFSSTMLLRWVISMCILHVISDAIAAARSMHQWMDDSGPWSYLKERFYDTERMLLANSDLISRHPAQLYYSVLPFLPSNTCLARRNSTPRGCISVLTGRETSWSPLLFTLSGGTVTAFTSGGHMFVVGRSGDASGIHIYNSNGLLNSSIRTISSDYTPYLAAFTEDGCGVVVVSADSDWGNPKASYRIEKFDLVKQNSQIYRTTPRNDLYPLKLSEYGSYVAFADHKDSLNRDTRISIWRTDGGDDTSIPLGCAAKVRDLDLAGESAHLVAVATKDITILSIPLGDVRQTLYHEGAEYVCISHDGSFLASRAWGEVRLWSITQGTLLASFESESISPAVFSRTNRLYVAEDDRGRVYDASTDPNRVAIKSFPSPSIVSSVVPVPHTQKSILPMPDESRILIRTMVDIQVWSLKLSDTRDAPRNEIMGIDISGDASLLALATETDIEIWDARIGQRLHGIQSRSGDIYSRPVAFSPEGELVVSSSDDEIIVVDVRAGVLMPTTYPFSPQGRDLTEGCVESVGISFDSSKLAAIMRYDQLSDESMGYICVWDLPSGTLRHSLKCGDSHEVQWSWTDQYLRFKHWRGNPRYLNAETFQEEVLEYPGDRFQGPNHLYDDWGTLRILLSGGREGPLFLALPSHLRIKYFSSRGDRACIFSWDGRLLLLNTSGLGTYMEICDLHFEPEATS